MFENPRRGRQARNFTINAPKILHLKSSSEQIFSRKLPLGAFVAGYQNFPSLSANEVEVVVVVFKLSGESVLLRGMDMEVFKRG